MKKPILLLALATCTLSGFAASDNNTVTLANAKMQQVAGNSSHLPKAVNPHQGQGLFSKRDGTCIHRTVYDNGYTFVTIDAKGTLMAQKNDVVEDIQVPCP